MISCSSTGVDWSNIAAIITACAAILTVVFSTLISKRQLAMQGFAVHRMDWIKEVRQLLSAFASEYIKKEHRDTHKLFELQTKIEVFMRRNSDAYNELLSHMTVCRQNEYDDLDYDLLILHSTYVLNRVWRRMVIEGKGRLLLSNKRIVRLVDKETASLKLIIDDKKREKIQKNPNRL